MNWANRNSEDAAAEWKKLASVAELVVATSKNREEFIQDCQHGKYDGVIAVFRTFQSVAMTGRWDESLCSKLPKTIKFLSHNGKEFEALISFSFGVRCNVISAPRPPEQSKMPYQAPFPCLHLIVWYPSLIS